jgi:branched-chain amino acid transport system permease protein
MARLASLIALVALAAACGGTSATMSPVGTGIGGVVVASPVCPVERPGDPGCAPRPVAGAVVIVRGADGAEVARATTAADGRYAVSLPPGQFTVEGAPVEGLMGNPSPIGVEVGDGIVTVDLQYDTGIR